MIPNTKLHHLRIQDSLLAWGFTFISYEHRELLILLIQQHSVSPKILFCILLQCVPPSPLVHLLCTSLALLCLCFLPLSLSLSIHITPPLFSSTMYCTMYCWVRQHIAEFCLLLSTVHLRFTRCGRDSSHYTQQSASLRTSTKWVGKQPYLGWTWAVWTVTNTWYFLFFWHWLSAIGSCTEDPPHCTLKGVHSFFFAYFVKRAAPLIYFSNTKSHEIMEDQL